MRPDMQPWKGRELLEIGYLLNRRFWHRGYAAEAAAGCKRYAFERLKADEVCSIIRDANLASQRVAVRSGMTPADRWVKVYRGVEMPRIRYVARAADGAASKRNRGGSGEKKAQPTRWLYGPKKRTAGFGPRRLIRPPGKGGCSPKSNSGSRGGKRAAPGKRNREERTRVLCPPVL